MFDFETWEEGSSPRVRGARCSRTGRYPNTGLIPARAGSTAFAVEYLISSPGSSPRVRGAQAIGA